MSSKRGRKQLSNQINQLWAKARENEQNIRNLHDLLTSRNIPTGFQDPDDVSMAMSSDTFQLSLTGTEAIFYSVKKRFKMVSTQSVDLSSYSSGDLIFIYFNAKEHFGHSIKFLIE